MVFNTTQWHIHVHVAICIYERLVASLFEGNHMHAQAAVIMYVAS
jgi:hypothetical protein